MSGNETIVGLGDASTGDSDTGVASALDRWFLPRGPYPVRAGNLVRPLIDGEPAFRRICEAIESAQHSVWLTVAFLWPSFEMPDGRGSLFDVLGRASVAGLDVRVICWRPGDELSHFRTNAFWGSPEHYSYLEAVDFPGLIRWDRAIPGFCQHQKSWIVDAGHDSATAFVGGINLNPHSVVAPGHHGEGHNHDAYVEIEGPCTADIHHNFVQRWNEASERDRKDGRWGEGAGLDLPSEFPEQRPRGRTVVQIQRTMPGGRHENGQGGLESGTEAIAAGERSIFDQYRAAIAAAQRSIYIENQAISVPEIVSCLREALDRGVEVVLLMPGESLPDSTLSALAELRGYRNLTVAGLAGRATDGRQRTHVYVHSKLMLIDDEWATIGSCNLHAFSLFGNAEMNASFWDPALVRELRCQLLAEHLAESTEHLDDVTALQRFREIARDNRRRWDNGDLDWPGLAFSLDVTPRGR